LLFKLVDNNFAAVGVADALADNYDKLLHNVADELQGRSTKHSP
jgi:hypothetical protein